MPKLRAQSVCNAFAFSVFVGVILLLAIGTWHAFRRSPHYGKTKDDDLHVAVVDLNAKSGQQPAIFIVCFSSGFSSNKEWQCLLKHWPIDERRFVRFLLPSIFGMGDSPSPADQSTYTVASHTDALQKALLKHVPNEKIQTSLHLVSICTGGIFALELASRIAPRSVSLISMPYFDSSDDAWARGAQYARWYKETWRLKMLYYCIMRQRWLIGPILNAKEHVRYPHLPGIYNAAMDGSLHAIEATVENAMALHRVQPAARVVGSNGITSAIVIRGERDSILCGTSQQQDLARTLNGKSFVLKSRHGANHLVSWHHTAVVMQQVKKFIDTFQ